jgi:hypothetical protein
VPRVYAAGGGLPPGPPDSLVAGLVVKRGALTCDAAYDISKLVHPVDQVEVARRVVAERLRRDEVRNLVMERIGSRRGEPSRHADFRAKGIIVTVIGPKVVDPEAVVSVLREVLVRL